jgi:hypothetical protein
MAMADDNRGFDSCSTHGFALSPEGTCVRCRNEARDAGARSVLAKAVGTALVATSLLGVGAVWAHGRGFVSSATPPEAPPVMVLASKAPVSERPPAAEEPVQVTSPETHAVLDAWEQELARANAQRAVEAAAEQAAKLAAQQRLEQDAVSVHPSSPSSTRRQHANLSTGGTSPEDHPSWWQDTPVRTRVRRTGVGGLGETGAIVGGGTAGFSQGANGVAANNVNNPNAWLPPNPGGFSTNRAPAGH